MSPFFLSGKMGFFIYINKNKSVKAGRRIPEIIFSG